VREFDQSYRDKEVSEFCDRVSMVLDQEVDGAYPVRWIGKVTVKTTDGRELHGRVDEPKGDPGNTLSRPELEAKAIELAEFAGAATAAEMNASMKDIWAICDQARVSDLLPPWSQEV
jgi:2-methylcitrate dehydratase PrpD